MNRASRWLAGLLVCALAPVALAQGSADAVARVEAYLATVNTLSADFSQVVRNRDGQIVDRASGKLSLSRPDRFRWDYQKPYLQTIVADGKQLWLYDSDLEQVTVRALEQGLGSTPAMLLSGSGKVGDAFASAAVQRQGDWTWYRLAPKQQGSDFDQVSLAFDRKGELAAMELRDKLGQTTVIEFGALRRNVALDQQLFRFEPPPGADVIGRAGP
jgi:outer membrane lipoprotein carrier protein